jgi:putative cofactor-binding repeat protein
MGAASLTDRPLRCSAAEATLLGKSVDAKDMDATVRAGRAALASETHTIDDIRSTAKYRSAVAGNLLEEFLRSLAS